MNPVLLKPQSDIGAQVVVQGRVVGNAEASDYQRARSRSCSPPCWIASRGCAPRRTSCWSRARAASEINLRAGDIANMGFARAADVPVVLIGDIDRGGVIASLVGTHAVLAPEDARMIEGFIINKFRGDPALFDEGLAPVERAHRLARPRPRSTSPAADGCRRRMPCPRGAAREAAPAPCASPCSPMPRIANFDDFDPLRLSRTSMSSSCPPGEPLPGDADLVILPGTKATIADLAFLRARAGRSTSGHARRGGRVLGICGGYQMLGTRVSDPAGIEGPPAERRAWGCWISKPCWAATSAARSRPAPGRRRAPPFAATRCTSGARRTRPRRPLLRFATAASTAR